MTKANCYTLNPKTHRYELGTPNPPERHMSKQNTETVDQIGMKRGAVATRFKKLLASHPRADEIPGRDVD